MELQLLSVMGTKKPIILPPHPNELGLEENALVSVEDAARPEFYTSPRNWPITNNMLQTLAIP